jgi:hypothetical protein
MNIVPISLEYYDKNRETSKKYIKRAKYYKLVGGKYSDTEKTKIFFYDEEKNIINKYSIERLGKYINRYNTWIWSWAEPYINKRDIARSRKILNYGLDLNINHEDPGVKNRALFLKTELITSRFKITNLAQIEIYIAIASYLSKTPFIFSHFTFFAINQDKTELKKISTPPKNIVDSNKQYFIEYFYILDECNDEK